MRVDPTIRLASGIVTLFAAAGAWMLGRRAGRRVAGATSAPEPPRGSPSEEPIVDAVEVPPRQA